MEVQSCCGNRKGFKSECLYDSVLVAPYLVYRQDTDGIICKLIDESEECVCRSRPLTVEEVGTRVCLLHSRENNDEIIGFDLTNLSSNLAILLEVFRLYQAEDLTMLQIVEGFSLVCRRVGYHESVFGLYKKFFVEHPLAQEIKLTTILLNGEGNDLVNKVITAEVLDELIFAHQ